MSQSTICCHVTTEQPLFGNLPGLLGLMYLAQGHNMVVIDFDS